MLFLSRTKSSETDESKHFHLKKKGVMMPSLEHFPMHVFALLGNAESGRHQCFGIHLDGDLPGCWFQWH